MNNPRIAKRHERMRGFLAVKAAEMRAAMTGAELALHGVLGPEWLRQEPICGAYIADFARMDVRLVIEADGGYHDDPTQVYKDGLRDKAMEAFGFEVMRFRNEEVMRDLAGTLATIEAKVAHIRTTRYVPKELPVAAKGALPPCLGCGLVVHSHREYCATCRRKITRHRRDHAPKLLGVRPKPFRLSPHKTTPQDRGD